MAKANLATFMEPTLSAFLLGHICLFDRISNIPSHHTPSDRSQSLSRVLPTHYPRLAASKSPALASTKSRMSPVHSAGLVEAGSKFIKYTQPPSSLSVRQLPRSTHQCRRTDTEKNHSTGCNHTSTIVACTTSNHRSSWSRFTLTCGRYRHGDSCEP